MARKYNVISADSHLEIPADQWTHRVAKEYRDRAPRRIKLHDGNDAHILEGMPIVINGLNQCGGRYEDTYHPDKVDFDHAPGCGGPEQRVREQDMDGVDAEVLFGGTSAGQNFWRGIKDPRAYQAVLRGYNDYVGDEFCSYAPDRLIGLGLIPDTGMEDSLEELRHCHKLGLRGVTLNSFPAGKMYPTLEDDRFWAEALDLNMTLTVHVMLRGFGGGDYKGPWVKYDRTPEPEFGGAGSDPVGRMCTYYTIRGAQNAVQFIFGGVFDRFPTLKVYFAETLIGWIPNWVEQMENFYKRNKFWAERLYGLKPPPRPLSEYVYEHCYWGFQYNPVGIKLRHEMNVDRLMWASDFPHSECDWPNSLKVIEETFEGVPQEEKGKMTAGNAVELFHLDAQ